MLRLIKIKEQDEEDNDSVYTQYINEDEIRKLYLNTDDKYVLEQTNGEDIIITNESAKMLKKKFCKSLDFEKQ